MSHQTRSILSVLSLSLSLAACAGSFHVSGSPHSRPIPVHFETEPNDAAFDADFVGTLTGSQRLLVHGDLQAEYGDIDGFAFVPSEPILIDFALAVHDPFGDLAICIYDPILDEYIACYDSVYDEKGSFEVLQPGREFHLVVYSEHFDCGSSYDLDLVVTRLSYGPEAQAGTGAEETERPVLPRAAGTLRMAVPEGVQDYGRKAAPRGQAKPGPVAVTTALRVTIDPSGGLADVQAGALVRRPGAE